MQKNKITAKELEEKFDEGKEDVLGHFEMVDDDGLAKPKPNPEKKISAALSRLAQKYKR